MKQIDISLCIGKRFIYNLCELSVSEDPFEGPCTCRYINGHRECEHLLLQINTTKINVVFIYHCSWTEMGGKKKSYWKEKHLPKAANSSFISAMSYFAACSLSSLYTHTSVGGENLCGFFLYSLSSCSSFGSLTLTEAYRWNQTGSVSSAQWDFCVTWFSP